MSWINGTIINFLSKLDWGTVADWVSGIGSCGAVFVALGQIIWQKEKEKEDKILANRPFFSCTDIKAVKIGKDHLWVTAAYGLTAKGATKNTPQIFSGVIGDNRHFDSGIRAYEFRNVSQAVATSLVLKIEYINIITGEVEEIDCCNIGTSLLGNERAIILPESIINNSSYTFYPKKIYLYFTSIDNKAYCQTWVQKTAKNSLYIEQVGIKKDSKEKMSNKESYFPVQV